LKLRASEARSDRKCGDLRGAHESSRVTLSEIWFYAGIAEAVRANPASSFAQIRSRPPHIEWKFRRGRSQIDKRECPCAWFFRVYFLRRFPTSSFFSFRISDILTAIVFRRFVGRVIASSVIPVLPAIIEHRAHDNDFTTLAFKRKSSSSINERWCERELAGKNIVLWGSAGV